MRARTFFRAASGAAIAGAFATYARYLRDLKQIDEALEQGSQIANTRAGPIEYAQQGEGTPLLLIHGAGGGYNQGLLIGRDFGRGHRLIAPSRFGYLKTPVPRNASPEAQADAHAALLDFLRIDRAVVVAASAGGPSALELALRHPERVSSLVLLVPRAYHPGVLAHADESAESRAVLRLVETSADLLFWLAIHVSRRSVVRFLGVPPEVEARASHEERKRVSKIMWSIMPLSRRVRGIEVDSGAEILPLPLDKIGCPVLVISAKDDLYGTLPGARFTTEHIPRSELHVLESGGHLMVGQSARVREIVQDFLRKNATRRGGRIAVRPKQLELS
jgi:pimeloyl-ACP methyl ester carboxylesterase